MGGTTDVLIAGAGPVGLMLAGELQRRGVAHRLVEAHDAPVRQCKALGVTPLTLDIFDEIGVLEDALARGLFLRGSANLENGVVLEWLATDLAGDGSEPPALQESAEGDVRHLRLSGLPFGFFDLAQYETEAILRERLHRHGGRVEGGTQVLSFEANDDDVAVRLRRTDGAEERVSCRYLVGCDGAHSVVRHGLDLPYEGDAFPMTYLLGDVALSWDLPRPWVYKSILKVDGELQNVVVAVPVPGDPRRYRLSMAAAPELWAEDADLRTPPTLEQIRATAAAALPPGTGLSDLRWSSFYRISHRIVPRYRTGRVFLAGDAAHIHPPIGGQGMNTGLQDAYNLGWKLALDVAGIAAPDLLDSYHAERHRVGLDVVERTSARMSRAIEAQDDSHDEILIDSQMTVHYRDGAWIGSDEGNFAGGPAPGERARDATDLARTDVAGPTRWKDVLRGALDHVLVLYADPSVHEAEHRALASLADEVRSACRDRIRVVGVASAGARPPAHERFPWLVDARGSFRLAYGTLGPCAYLIRPDGYVAHRSAPLRREGLLASLAKVLAER